MAKAAVPKSLFAAIPKRAIGDPRFSTIHFRVLAAVAAHDRMSASRGKGAGCFASNKTLADMCRVNYANFSTAIAELGRWEYVEASMHPLSKRTRVYRVIYGDERPADSLPSGKALSPADTLPKGKHWPSDSLPEHGQTVCPPSSQATDPIEHPNDNIFSETVRYSAKHKNNSSEEAALRSAELRNGYDKTAIVGANLAKLEWWLKAQDDDVELPRDWHVYLEEVRNDFDEDHPLARQATRLLESWGL